MTLIIVKVNCYFDEYFPVENFLNGFFCNSQSIQKNIQLVNIWGSFTFAEEEYTRYRSSSNPSFPQWCAGTVQSLNIFT